MKATALLLTAALIFIPLAACNSPSGSNEPFAPSESTDLQGSPPPSEEDPSYFIGEGVTISYAVNGAEAELAITGCPAYGDKRTPYVYGKLIKGDPFAYELITIITMDGPYYGKKPFNNAPNGFIKADGTFQVQYSSNDGAGTDWNANSIFLFLVPVGYQDEIDPDIGAGYIVPPAQVSSLREDSICVVQIDRENLNP